MYENILHQITTYISGFYYNHQSTIDQSIKTTDFIILINIHEMLIIKWNLMYHQNIWKFRIIVNIINTVEYKYLNVLQINFGGFPNA